jgi:hypothetical protein
MNTKRRRSAIDNRAVSHEWTRTCKCCQKKLGREAPGQSATSDCDPEESNGFSVLFLNLLQITKKIVGSIASLDVRFLLSIHCSAVI